MDHELDLEAGLPLALPEQASSEEQGMTGQASAAPAPSLASRAAPNMYPEPTMHVAPTMSAPIASRPQSTRRVQSASIHGMGDSNLGNPHSLGLAILLTSIGGAIGCVKAGAFGSIGGALAGGSAANLFNAYKHSKENTEEGKKEAMISLTYSVIGLGLSGYLIYKGYTAKHKSRGEEV